MSDEEIKTGENTESPSEDVAFASPAAQANYSEGSTVIINPLTDKKREREAEFESELTENERAMFERLAKIDESTEERKFDYRQIHEETNVFFDFLGKTDPYPAILTMIKNGNFTAELKKRYMIKAIDEKWVETVEDALVALDSRIRNPSKFIEQNEEILPIELSRNISSRSVQHLSQHTNLISRFDGDEITPSKILNVFNDETLMTYENKFVNTLINRLYLFIAKRYDAALQSGRDEKKSRLNFKGDFSYGSVKGNMTIGIEVSETPEANLNLQNVLYNSDIWHRVERLYSIVKGYTVSEFASAMGKAYIRPPVMRTNAILKNKNLRKCLNLWEFIETYEDVGYEMLVEEKAEAVNDKYIEELYSAAALQYVTFRYNMQDGTATEDAVLNTASVDKPLRPKFIDEIAPITVDEFNVRNTVYDRRVKAGGQNANDGLTADPDVEEALRVAIKADVTIERMRREAAEKKAAEKRRAAEEAERLRIEEEKKRKAEEEAKLAEERAAEEEARRIAEEESRINAEREARRLAEEEKKRLEEEAQRIADEYLEEMLRKKRNNIARKKKKSLKRAAAVAAQKQGESLPKTFDLEIYESYLKK